MAVLATTVRSRRYGVRPGAYVGAGACGGGALLSTSSQALGAMTGGRRPPQPERRRVGLLLRSGIVGAAIGVIGLESRPAPAPRPERRFAAPQAPGPLYLTCCTILLSTNVRRRSAAWTALKRCGRGCCPCASAEALRGEARSRLALACACAMRSCRDAMASLRERR